MRLVWVVDDDWINLSSWTGRSIRNLPKALREPKDYLASVSTSMSEIGDVTCDPRRGGIAGYGHIARYYGVDEQRFRKNIAPRLDYLVLVYGIPVTHVSSAAADGARHKVAVKEKHRANLRQYQ